MDRRPLRAPGRAVVLFGLFLALTLLGAPVASAVVDGDMVTDTPASGGDHYRFTGRLVDGAGNFHCTASLITSTVAITARHCVRGVEDDQPTPLHIEVGMLNVTLAERGRATSINEGMRVRVTSIDVGRTYRCMRPIFQDGIVRLNLEEPVPASVATPARLAGKDDGVLWRDGRKMIALGWGLIRDDSDWTPLSSEAILSSELRRAELQVENQTVTLSLCRGALRADNIEQGRVTHGDSGGPLVTFDDSGPVVVGVLTGNALPGDAYYFKTGVDSSLELYWK